MTPLEHIKQLTHRLTTKQREELAAYLQKSNGSHKSKKVVSLRGSWGVLPDDFDLDQALREIRDEWKKELEFDL